MTESYPTYFHHFYKRKMLTGSEKIEDFKEVTEAEKTNLEAQDAAWERPPQSFIEEWNNICGVYGRYNEDTGYFELNGILDLSYSDAMIIMENPPQFLRIASNGFPAYAFAMSDIRTTFPLNGNGNGLGACNLAQTFKYCKNLEVVWVLGIHIIRVDGAFNSNHHNGMPSKLREIIIRNNYNDMVVANNDFPSSIEHLELLGLNSDLNIRNCNKISLESLRMTVDGCSNGKTFTVHEDVLAKLSGDTTNAAAAALSQEELAQWAELASMAEDKNITFATI